MGVLDEDDKLIPFQLRQATFIDPQTGERLKKRFTLHSYDGENGNPSASHGVANDITPLLRHRPSRSDSRRQRHTFWGRCATTAAAARAFATSDTGKGVLKCSFAYVLGSLATFVPALSSLLGHQDGKHMVATITVYFHPARTVGSMFEALVFAFTAFLYAAFITVTSMAVSVFFADKLDLMALGHAIVLVVFCGGGLGFVGWTKQTLGDPLVNVACSLGSLAIITILTKEGSVQAGDFSFAKIWQVLKMIVMGVIATMAVSFLIFPSSARSKLSQNMIDTTDSLAEMLAGITSSFLSGNEEELEQKTFVDASEQHKTTLATLGKNLKDARYEHFVFGTERECYIEAKLVHCVQRISQSIGGLKSAAAMQFIVVNQPPPAKTPNLLRGSESFSSMLSPPSTIGPPSRTISGDWTGSRLESINETPDEDEVDGGSPLNLNGDLALQLKSPSEIFSLFIEHLGPSMRSLAFTIKEILDELPYGPGPKYEVKNNPRFRPSLRQAVEMYSSARDEALKIVYAQKELDRTQTVEIEADWEEAAATCGHFSFCLLEVTEQVEDYLIILDELQLEVQERPAGRRTWSWLKFWKSKKNCRHEDIDPELVHIIEHADDLDLEVHIPNLKDQRPPTSPSSYQGKSPAKVAFFRRAWKALSFFRRDDIRFAIKVGIGAALYALPSFIPDIRPIYSHWRGEWGLLSYMLVCSMTIGASNTTGYSRFLGTFVGALAAIISWSIADDNPFILAFLGWIMAYGTAYIIVAQGKGPMGRYIMLTYNLSALYAYSLSVADQQGDDDEGGTNPFIFAITYHRTVAVLSGCVWGLIITRFVWPISARQKLKDGLSLLWLRMGLIWKRDPLALFLPSSDDTSTTSPHHYMNLREEFQMQRFVASLDALRAAARSEFELRGPFPDKTYARILESTRRMLDAFHAMNAVILKDLVAAPGEVALLQVTKRERAQLCARISHLFSVLASSMKLEYPLNDSSPNIEHTRDRLLARIFEFRQKTRGEVADEDFALLYAHALVTGQLGREIEATLKEVEGLFGVLDEEALMLQ